MEVCGAKQVNYTAKQKIVTTLCPANLYEYIMYNIK